MSFTVIEAAIPRHADSETLFDQPYEDNNALRVSGPFTVESLSPDRIVSTDEERPESERIGQSRPGRADFATMILENLRKAGVQNTFKNERLMFDRLEPHAGAWIHATGEYTNGDGKARRVAVTIGPEFGTVTPQQVKEAAKEAVSGIGFDILIVCGFAFDPHVSEEARRYGKLAVLPARMNPDLLIGDNAQEHRCGQPVHGLRRARHRRSAQNERQGRRRRSKASMSTTRRPGRFAAHRPTTSPAGSSTPTITARASSSATPISLGADDPYNKLKRALRAEIDEAAWAVSTAPRAARSIRPNRGRSP